MNNNAIFNNILNECLDRILQGESIEQCLQNYPEQAKELEPLLLTAQAAKIASTIQPRTEFKARARYEFQSALRDIADRKSRPASFFPWRWQWQSGWAIAIVSILIVVLSGVGIVIASGSSMPDNALYSVKLAAEKVHLVFSFSDIGKAELNAEFADKRVEEIIYLATKGDPQDVQIVAKRLNSNLVTMNSLVGDNGGQITAFTGGTLESPKSTSRLTGESQPMMAAAAAPPAAELTTIPPPSAAALAPAAVTALSQNPNPDSALSRNSLSGDNSLKNTNAKVIELEKLKQSISYKAVTNEARMEEALDKASPEVRPALRQALAQALAEYEKAIKIIEHTMSTE